MDQAGQINEIKEKLQSKSILMAILGAFALFSVVILIFTIGISIWFWIILLLWLVIFIGRFLIVFIKTVLIFWVVTFILFAISLLFSFGALNFLPGVNTSSNSTRLVDCRATASQKPQKVAGWNVNLYPGTMDPVKGTPDPDQAKPLPASISYTDIINKVAPINIFLRMEKDDKSFMSKTVDPFIEVCDVNNKTVWGNSTGVLSVNNENRGNNVSAVIKYLQKGYIQQKEGTYRVDGWVYIDGTWTLTNRIESVKFVK